MRSRTFFEPALWRKNMARFWPLWGAYFLTWAIPLPLLMAYQFFGRLPDASSYLSAAAQRTDLLRQLNSHVLAASTQAAAIIPFLFAVLMAMAAFSFLYTHRSAIFYHSLPMTRAGLFFTSYLSGLGFLLLPNLAVFLLTLLAEAVCGAVGMGALLTWLGSVSLACFFFYTFAVFCGVFVGQLLSLPVFYFILSFLVPGVEWMVRLALSEFVYGFPGDIWFFSTTFLAPVVQLCEKLDYDVDWRDLAAAGAADAAPAWEFFGWEWLLIYAAAAAALLLAAFLVYRKRRVESAGDLVSVRAVRPVFKYGVAVCVSLALGRWLYEIFSGSGSVWALLVHMLIAGFLGYYAAEMLLKKSFRVFKSGARGFLVFALVAVCGMAAMEYDLFGYERRVPDAGAVAGALVTEGRGRSGSALAESDSLLTDPADVEAVLALHRSLAEGKKAVEAQLADRYAHYAVDEPWSEPSFPSSATRTVTLSYLLTSGRTLTRSYTVPITADLLRDEASPAARLAALWSRPAVLRQNLYSGDAATFRFRGGGLEIYENGLSSSYRSLGSAEAARVFRAVLRDVDAGAINWVSPLQDSAACRAFYANELYLDYEIPDSRGGWTGYSISITLRTESAETLAVLRELGILGEGDAGLITELQRRVLQTLWETQQKYADLPAADYAGY